MKELLGSTQIRQYGVVVVKDTDTNTWSVYKFENPYKDNVGSSEFIGINNMQLVFGPCTDMLQSKINLNTYYEDYDNYKLYIADGKHPLMQINLTKDANKDKYYLMNQITAYPSVLFNKPVFCGLISGNLKAGLVQYSYQLYNKYGNQTEISPSTKLIPLHNGSTEISNSIKGYEKDKNTNKGVKVKIKVESKYLTQFTNIILYRVMYIENGQLPTIEKIADERLSDYDNGTIYIYDTGQDALSKLTLEEYNSMTGIHIIPKVIETKNDYLFAANIKTQDALDNYQDIKNYDTRAYQYNKDGITELYDFTAGTTVKTSSIPSMNVSHDCFNPANDMSSDLNWNDPAICKYTKDGSYYGGTGKYISWRFITTNVTGDGSKAGDNDAYYGACGSNVPYITLKDDIQFTNKITAYYIKNTGDLEETTVDASSFFETNLNNRTYANPSVSYYLKSLRRGELYRYGIVLYDDKGNTSSVKWIADIRVPSMYTPGFNTFVSHGDGKDLIVRPLGIQFTVTNLPSQVVGYEIVRVNRTVQDIVNISQGVISRPVRRYYDQAKSRTVMDNTLTPTGFLSTAGYLTGKQWSGMLNYGDDETNFGWVAFNNAISGLVGTTSQGAGGGTVTTYSQTLRALPNYDIYQYVSPETVYQEDTFKQYFSSNDLKLNPQLYLFGSLYDQDTKIRHRINNGNDYFQLTHKDSEIPVTSSGLIYSSFIYPSTTSRLKLYLSGLKINFPDQNITGVAGRLIISPTVMTSILYYNTDITKVYSGANAFSSTYGTLSGVYSYIKLYESSNSVCIQDVDKDPFYQLTNPNIYKKTISNQNSYDISYTAFPKTLGWDDLAAQTQNENKQYPLKYVDSKTSIGGQNFCNFVSGGLYNMQIDNDGSDVHFSNEWLNDTDTYVGGIFGPGGKTSLICLSGQNESSIKVENDGLFGQNTTHTVTVGDKFRLADTCFTDSRYKLYGNDIKQVGAPTFISSAPSNQDRIDMYGQSNYLFRESILGTYLCNIRQNVTPYGGYQKQIRDLSQYASHGDYFSSNNAVATVFDGDCFIQPFEYVSLHKWYHSKVYYPRNACIVYSIPVETNINLVYDYGYNFSKNINSASGDVTNIQVQASNVYNKFIQPENMYQYNAAYSSNPTIKKLTAEISDEDNKYDYIDYRVMFSNQKTNNENIDSWLKFMPANYLDVDTRLGEITNLRKFHNQLLFWQEQAVGLLSVNERVAITDDSNLPLMLGTGGILSRYDYINTSNGMHKNQYSDAQSDSTLYWWDYNKHELCSYAGGQQCIIMSKNKLVQNVFNKAYNENKLSEEPILLYDKRFDELIANTTTDTDKHYNGSMVYNEDTNVFQSIYSVHPYGCISFPDRLYMLDKNANIYEWNQMENCVLGLITNGVQDKLTPYLKYIVNQNANITKVFDNQEFGGRVYGGDNLSAINLQFSTPLKQKSKLQGDKIVNVEYNFRYEVPRNNNDFYGGRMRGKTMQCELSSDSNSYDFSLQFILTKYRISCS